MKFKGFKPKLVISQIIRKNNDNKNCLIFNVILLFLVKCNYKKILIQKNNKDNLEKKLKKRILILNNLKKIE